VASQNFARILINWKDRNSYNKSRGDNKYSKKNNNYSSRNIYSNQEFRDQNKSNIGDLERMSRSKYSSQVVKGAMYAIQRQLPDGRKRYAKDLQASLHV
jgi:hypothetical protein